MDALGWLIDKAVGFVVFIFTWYIVFLGSTWGIECAFYDCEKLSKDAVGWFMLAALVVTIFLYWNMKKAAKK